MVVKDNGLSCLAPKPLQLHVQVFDMWSIGGIICQGWTWEANEELFSFKISYVCSLLGDILVTYLSNIPHFLLWHTFGCYTEQQLIQGSYTFLIYLGVMDLISILTNSDNKCESIDFLIVIANSSLGMCWKHKWCLTNTRPCRKLDVSLELCVCP
jgi:hypothetical protein